MFGIMNYLLLMPNLVAFYAKLNEKLTIECHFALKVSFSIFSSMKGCDLVLYLMLFNELFFQTECN